MKDELLSLPKLIKEKQIDILELQKQLRLVQYKKKEMENKTMLEVFEERDKFGSMDMRKVEAQRRLRKNQKYRELLDYERELIEMLNREKIELEYLKNRFSGIKYYVRYLSSLEED